MLDQKSLRLFLALAFGLAWALFLLPLAFGAPGSPARQLASVVGWSAAMWAPGIAALAATRFAAHESLASLNLRRLGPRRVYLWAWLLPPALTLAAGALTVILGVGRLDPHFTAMRAALAQASTGPTVEPALVVAGQTVFAVLLAPVVNLVVTMGEELGWRGFLLPRLMPLGQARAIILSGAIWGIWHTPAILQGHNFPGYPLPGVLMMTVWCILFGAILSWLYLRTGSPWAPALAHGAVNATGALPILFLRDVNVVFGGTLVSLVGWLPVALFLAWLVRSGRLPVREPHLPPSPSATLQTAENA